ncbi:MAG: biotin--[acetyl-CoA-carboxylase] ligase [Actinomycetota bacterium]
MNNYDPDSLRAALPDWVPECRYLARTDSTNRQAMDWALQGAPHGSVVLADFQTAGRGRLGREWTAPAGSSLLFSIVLRPQIDPERRPLLTLAAGVAVCGCLAGLGFEPELKWPNDVLLAGRKVAGILAEANGEVVILGIGINTGRVEFPEHLAGSAISLEASSGRACSRLELLSNLIEHLAREVDGPADEVVDRYRRWSSTPGRRVRVDLGSGPLEDLAVDIDPGGGLVLAGGQVVRAGDVLQLR